MILKGLKQDWQVAGMHALFFAEIWMFIGVALGSANKIIPLPWLATGTEITLGGSGCLALTWIGCLMFEHLHLPQREK